MSIIYGNWEENKNFNDISTEILLNEVKENIEKDFTFTYKVNRDALDDLLDEWLKGLQDNYYDSLMYSYKLALDRCPLLLKDIEESNKKELYDTDFKSFWIAESEYIFNNHKDEVLKAVEKINLEEEQKQAEYVKLRDGILDV